MQQQNTFADNDKAACHDGRIIAQTGSDGVTNPVLFNDKEKSSWHNMWKCGDGNKEVWVLQTTRYDDRFATFGQPPGELSLDEAKANLLYEENILAAATTIPTDLSMLKSETTAQSETAATVATFKGGAERFLLFNGYNLGNKLSLDNKGMQLVV